MSIWYDLKQDDIDLSDDYKEIHLFLYQDNMGCVYASVKVKDIIDLLFDNSLILKKSS